MHFQRPTLVVDGKKLMILSRRRGVLLILPKINNFSQSCLWNIREFQKPVNKQIQILNNGSPSKSGQNGFK